MLEDLLQVRISGKRTLGRNANYPGGGARPRPEGGVMELPCGPLIQKSQQFHASGFAKVAAVSVCGKVPEIPEEVLLQIRRNLLLPFHVSSLRWVDTFITERSRPVIEPEEAGGRAGVRSDRRVIEHLHTPNQPIPKPVGSDGFVKIHLS